MAEKTEDLNLPVAAVGRIMKEALPDGIVVSKEARLAIARAASVFVLYATSNANGFAEKANRRTVSSADVLEALKEMDFEDFVDPLRQLIDEWKTGHKAKKSSKPPAEQPSSKTVKENGLPEEVDLTSDKEEEDDDGVRHEKRTGDDVEEEADTSRLNGSLGKDEEGSPSSSVVIIESPMESENGFAD